MAGVVEFDKKVLQKKIPTFRFTKLDENTYNFSLDNEGKFISHNFKLDESSETKRRDGSVVSYTIRKYTTTYVVTEEATKAIKLSGQQQS